MTPQRRSTSIVAAAALLCVIGSLLVPPASGPTAPRASPAAFTLAEESGHPAAAPLPWTGLAIPVPGEPWGEALDPSNGLLFVSESLAANVVVVNTSADAVVATLPVGSDPMGVAYDPANGYVYVANSGSLNVSILNGTSLRVIGALPVGTQGSSGQSPVGVAVDPVNGQLYVSFSFSGTCVRVFNATSGAPVAAVPTAQGSNCGGFGFDPHNGQIYVSAVNFSLTYVINATSNTLTSTIHGAAPNALVFDPADGEMVGAGNDQVVFLNGTSETVAATDNLSLNGEDLLGEGVVFDPATAMLFVSGFASPVVELNGSTGAVVGEIPWISGNDLVLGPSSAELFATESSPDQVVTFPATVYPVTVNVTGDVSAVDGPWQLNVSSPSGGTWTWFSPLNPNGTFLVPNGTYDYAATVLEWMDYTPTLPNGSFVVDGTGVSLSVAFAAASVFPVTFDESGLPYGSSWSVTSGPLPTTNESSTAALSTRARAGFLPIDVRGPAGYSIAAISGPGSPTVSEINVSGVSQFALRFLPVFTVTFGAVGLPPGSLWGVTVDSTRLSGGPAPQTAATTATSLVLPLPKGTWRFEVTTKPSTDRAVHGHGIFTLGAKDLLRTLRFVEVVVRVAFVATGLPRGTEWTVNVTGPMGTTSLRSTSPGLSELLPNGSYSFEVGAVGTRPPVPANGAFVLVAPHAELRVKIAFGAAVLSALPDGPNRPLDPVAMPGRPRG